MQRPACYDELMVLLGALCDEDVSEPQWARLNEILESDPCARRFYMQYMDLHANLSRRASFQRNVPKVEFRGRRWRVAALVAAAAAIFLALGLALAPSRLPTTESTAETVRKESYSNGIAIVKRATGTLLALDAQARQTGGILSPGTYRVESGAVEIQLYTGTSFVLMPQAEFTLSTSQELHCLSGRVRVDIPPPVNGFRLHTPHFTVVDLGTQYGVDIAGEQSEVHVFSGAVELTADTRSFSKVGAGEAVTVVKQSETRRHTALENLFLTSENLKMQAAERDAKTLGAWKYAATSRQKDDALLAHFDFENLAADSRILPNRAASDPALSGVIVGCAPEQGRWPGKGALGFRNLGDRVRVRIPGSYRSLTMTTWVRIDGLDRPHNALFMTDAFGPGSIHWQIQNEGVVEFSIAGQKDGIQPVARYATPAILNSAMFGKWVHLAVVYDADDGVVVQYLNGKPVSKRAIKLDALVFPGNGELGNWNPADLQDRKPIRFFSGRMDDFAVYARALAEEEIQALHKSGSVDGVR